MLYPLASTCFLFAAALAQASQSPEEARTLPSTAAERQAAVERGLLAREWVDGHGFDLQQRLRTLNVPGVSIAVIHEGKVDWAAGYGVRDEVSGLPVTTDTLFQAASISKSVAGMTALRLAQEGLYSIDDPVAGLLESYQLPASSFEGEVTPRRLMSHTAGLNVHGFGGYRPEEAVPTAAALLRGEGNSRALRRIEEVGARFRYSGGGSTLLQVALQDLSGLTFDALAQEKVLGPLGMTRSTYVQPLATKDWPNHAAGHDGAGARIPGRFHVYPEQYAAGLWTTPSDLALFILEMQEVAAGEEGQVLTSEWGRTMLTPVTGEAGLGVFVTQFDGEPWFHHSGSNQGFMCDFRASFEGGSGVVVMTNGDQGAEIFQEVICAVAKVYGWNGMLAEPLKEVPLSSEQLDRLVGNYAFDRDDAVQITQEQGRLMIQQLPYPKMPLVALGVSSFQILATPYEVEFQGDSSEEARSLSISMDADRLAHRLSGEESRPVLQLLQGKVDQAVERYRAWHRADSKDPMVARRRLTGLAMGLLDFGQAEAAHDLAQAVTGLYPTDARAWEALAHVRFMLQDKAESKEAYLDCLRVLMHDRSLDSSARTQLLARVEERLNLLDG